MLRDGVCKRGRGAFSFFLIWPTIAWKLPGKPLMAKCSRGSGGGGQKETQHLVMHQFKDGVTPPMFALVKIETRASVQLERFFLAGVNAVNQT